MEAIFLKLVNMSITASWLVLAIIAVRLIFKKAPKWILCLLWGLVAFRLICPFSIESSLSLIPDSEPLSQEYVYTTETVKPAHGDILDSEGNVILEQHPAANGDFLDAEGNVIVEVWDSTRIYPEKEQTHSWMYILSRIWVIGFCVMLTYTAVSYYLLKKKVATAIPLKRGIKQSEYVDSPFVLGIIRPVIYLPFSMEEGDMTYVIAHEKAHIRRRDHWWKPLGFLLLSVYWFNPVLWVAYILLCRDIEAACDEKVIKDMEKDERRAYSTALLNCSIHRHRIAACPLAFGETGVKARVKSVMNYKKPAFWVILIALVVSIIVAVCFLTNPETEDEDTSGYDLIEMVTSQNGYSILFQEHTKINLVIEKSKLPEDSFTLKGHSFEVMEVNPYQTFAANKLYLKHVGIDEERSEYLRFTFAFQTDSLEKENLLLPYDVDVDGNGFVCNVEVNQGEVWDNQKTYENAAYFDPVTSGEGFCVLVKKSICEAAGHHIAFMLNDMNRLTYEVREETSPVTISLENARPTGATILFHQNQELSNGPLLCNYEYFLQQQVNGKWEDLPKKADIQFPNQTYDIAVLHHNGVDWEQLYGRLPVGNYRLGKVIPITSGENPEYTTVYAEFSIDNVYTWFDRYSTESNEHSPKDTLVELFGLENVTLSYNAGENTIYRIDLEGREPIITCDVIFRNVFLTDLTGDGISEVCATVQNDNTTEVQVYDASAEKLYELPAEGSGHKLTKKADRLCIYWNDVDFGNPVGYWQLALQPGKGIVLADLDPEVETLKSKLVCVDVNTRKRICLSSTQQLNQVMALLKGLQDTVTPATAAELAEAEKNGIETSWVTVNYELGEKNLFFSENYDLVWEPGSSEAFRIPDPEPFRLFFESVTDGVRNKETSGEPFATVDAPWDWCAGVTVDAISDADVYVCLDVTSNGGSTYVSGTNGVLPADRLSQFLGVLNQVPKDAFSDSGRAEKTFRWFAHEQTEGSASISVIDGVNQLAVAIRIREGYLEMIMTEELDKAQDMTSAYLDPAAKIWTIQDPALRNFMEKIAENPTVINYSVGAEYDWQGPIEFSKGKFNLELYLIENWIYEEVKNSTNSGIRCRPKDEDEGWIYFSFWPDGYIAEEEDFHYEERTWNSFPSKTAYPSGVLEELGFVTREDIWSFEMVNTDAGDFTIINDGADNWFPNFVDEIYDTLTLLQFTTE